VMQGGFLSAEQGLSLPLFEHAAIVHRHNLDELVDRPVPVAENSRGDRTSRVAGVLDQEVADKGQVFGLLEPFEVNHLPIAALGKVAGFIEDERRATAHAGRKIASSRADHDGDASGHVLAAMVTRPFNNREGSAVADAEAFTRTATEERPPAG